MARQPNAGRDIESDILRSLVDGPMTVPEMEDELHVSQSTLRDHMRRLLQRGWSETVRPKVFGASPHALTPEGRRVAEARGLTGRAEG